MLGALRFIVIAVVCVVTHQDMVPGFDVGDATQAGGDVKGMLKSLLPLIAPDIEILPAASPSVESWFKCDPSKKFSPRSIATLPGDAVSG